MHWLKKSPTSPALCVHRSYWSLLKEFAGLGEIQGYWRHVNIIAHTREESEIAEIWGLCGKSSKNIKRYFIIYSVNPLILYCNRGFRFLERYETCVSLVKGKEQRMFAGLTSMPISNSSRAVAPGVKGVKAHGWRWLVHWPNQEVWTHTGYATISIARRSLEFSSEVRESQGKGGCGGAQRAFVCGKRDVHYCATEPFLLKCRLQMWSSLPHTPLYMSYDWARWCAWMIICVKATYFQIIAASQGAEWAVS